MAISKLPQREETLKRRRKQNRIKYGFFFFFLLLLIGGLSYVSYLPKVRINEVILRGGVLVTEKEVKEESLRFVQGSYFWLFPKNNAFLYQKKDLEKHLSSNFKRIETIKIYLEGLNKMVVEITERKPQAIWCKENVQPVGTSTEELSGFGKEICYFIDSYSTIFAVAPDFSGDAYFKYYGLVDGDDPIGKEYMSSSTEFTQINDFIKSVKNLNLKPLYLKSKGLGEFSLVLRGGSQIFFDKHKPLDLTFKNLETLLESPELSLKQGYLPVEYIDLRYGNKLFYKLKI